MACDVDDFVDPVGLVDQHRKLVFGFAEQPARPHQERVLHLGRHSAVHHGNHEVELQDLGDSPDFLGQHNLCGLALVGEH